MREAIATVKLKLGEERERLEQIEAEQKRRAATSKGVPGCGPERGDLKRFLWYFTCSDRPEPGGANRGFAAIRG
jgi:hypothetical protein